MPRLRFLTAGESHGKALVAILEGLPAGLPVVASRVDALLALRQRGWGRGGRMKIEQDRVEVLSGVRHGLTLGSPVALLIPNRDWENWSGAMAAEGPARGEDTRRVTAPRPGHADLAGGMKYGHRDLRNVLERASARETAARVAAGAVAGLLLERLGVTVTGLVEEIGGVRARVPEALDAGARRSLDESECRCPDAEAESLMRRRIDEAAAAGNTVGGVFQVRAEGVVPGLGSYVHWDRRLDARLAAALMSIPGVKGVEVGLGFRGAHLAGTSFHDAVTAAAPDASRPWRYRRTSNNAGGLEGGVTNGEAVVLRAVMKPIPTTARGLGTVDIESGQETLSHRERSDVCAVPAASVVGQAVAALELADACLEKFGGDTLEETLEARGRYLARLSGY